MGYIPLNVHSQFSILDSTASVVALAEKAKAFGMSSLALTDQGNLYGAIDFYKACKASGIKPIFGCKIWMAPESRTEKKKVYGVPNGMPIILLAKDDKGYKNLCKLSSIGFLEGFYYQPRIDKEVLLKHREGLVCLLSAPLARWIRVDNFEAALQEFLWYRDLFQDDLYLELQRVKINEAELEKESWLLQKMQEFVKDLQKVETHFRKFSQEYGTPLVATNPIHYLQQDDWQAHEILLNIQSGEAIEIWERDSMGNVKSRMPNPKRDVAFSREYYFKSQEEMQKIFSDLPEALLQSLKIAEKCTCEMDLKTKHYPVFIPPSLEGRAYSKEERKQAAEKYLYDLCVEGIAKRYTKEALEHVQKKYPDKDPLQVVKDRFLYEFEILSSKGMSDYMLIVYDFINWAKKRGIPMGPGRGSAAGSLISYLMGITDIEPLRFHLFFERFINPERISYPDIDVDICMNRRGEVIDYVVGKYGKDKVAQIITFGTMKAKMAIRDVGRVLNVPLSKVNQIAALVPEDPTMTLEKAFEIDPELKKLMETDGDAKRVLEMAQKVEGSIRNTSTHAAGLIISESAITEHIPVCVAKDSDMVVTQYAMKPVESVGMLKIDFLGLKTLTSLQVCADAVAKNMGKRIDWSNLPLDDTKTFSLLNQKKTLGVFQIETGGMADLTQQLHIDMFEEMIAVVSLFRPGPMDMIPSYIQRKHGQEAIEIDHPLMKDILSETYGVMVYQEQVMQIASALAGYSLGEGDVLRRAMGKKDKDEMARQREKFLTGALAQNIDQATSGRIFDKIEKFASYGFNKSHAAAYAYLSYATAYFKAHFPKEWMSALMTCDRDDTGKVAVFIQEAKSLGIAVLPPDVNEAGSAFSATSAGIRFALSGIKGVGSNVVEAIIQEREVSGKFTSLYNFIERMAGKVGKKQIELLVHAGCFDFTKWSRDAMALSIESMWSYASNVRKDQNLGILNLFSLIEEPVKPFTDPPLVVNPSSKEQLLQKEKELLGFYLSGHPMDGLKSRMQQLSSVPLGEIPKLSDQSLIRIAFIIDALQLKVSSKTQKKFAILTISDGLEKFELPIWAEMYEAKQEILKENQICYALVQVEIKDRSTQLSCRFLESFASMDEQKMKACDTLYDQAKMQQMAKEGRWKKEKEKDKPAVTEKEISNLTISLNADMMRLSHVLQLKDLFREHPGTCALELHWMSGAQRVGVLSIDEKWGVKADKSFLEKLDVFLKKHQLYPR